MDNAKSDERQIAVALIVYQGFVLVQQRSKVDHLPGYWEFPGGKIEYEESPLEAVVREVKEETGIRLNRIKPVWDTSVDYQYPEKTLKLHFFCFNFREKPIVLSDAVIWLEIHQLSAIKTPPANHTVIDRLIRETENS